MSELGLMSEYREPTMYENVFKYTAPEGFEWWVNDTNYGNVIWGGKQLDNYYYLKKKDGRL